MSKNKITKAYLALFLIIALILPSMGITVSAAPSVDLNRNEVYTAEEGNLARMAGMTQLADTGNYYTAGNPGAGLGRTGVNAQYSNAGGRNGILRINDGTKNQSATAAWNNWGSDFGVDSNPVYIVYNFGQPYVIDAMRAEFAYDGNGYSSGTQIPRQAFFEYWDGSAWVRVTNISRPAGDEQGDAIAATGTEAGNFVNDAHIGGNNSIALAARPNWNKVVFDTPVVASLVRLCLTQRQTGINTNGIGVSEWEVFGKSDPVLSDLAWIDITMFQNMTENVTLPATGPAGSTFVWSDSTNSALSNTGTVTRPYEYLGNATGTIKVTASHPDAETASEIIPFTVLREMPFAAYPQITEQPAAAVTVDRENPSAVLSVTATVSDGGTLSYQWFRVVNNAPQAIEGATSRTFEVPVNETGSFVHYVQVTNTNTAADIQTATVTSTNSAVTVLPAVISLEINPVNNLNPTTYTDLPSGITKNEKFRDFYRFDTKDTFLRPGESVQYNSIVQSIGVDPTPIWSVTGGVGTTAISSTGKLTVDENQPAGDITVTAKLGDLTETATVTVRIVNDENGYDQTAKWTAEPFQLSEVSIDDDSLWGMNRDITLRYLSQPNLEERLLKQFYQTAGYTTLPADVGTRRAGDPINSLADAQGWDSNGYASNRLTGGMLAGHGTGHYLSGIAQAFHVADDPEQKEIFRDKLIVMVRELGRIQDANIEKGSYMYGFLSAYTEHQFDVLEEDKQTGEYGGGDANANGRRPWAIYYTQHKILQGLMDIYNTLKDTEDDATAQRALEVASKMGDWTYLRLSRWTQAEREAMWNQYSAGEVGGIAQPIEALYFATGDELYRETAAFFENNNKWRVTGQAGLTNRDGYEVRPGTRTVTTRTSDGDFSHFAQGLDGRGVNGSHANTIIPMIVGALRQYEADTPIDLDRINPVGYTPAESHYYDIAKNFFHVVYTTRLSPIGGTGNGNNGEIFDNLGTPVTPRWSPILATGNSANGANESCTTVNMMMLAQSLFRHEQLPEYMDYYEKALVNHVLPTLDQRSGEGTNRIDYLKPLATDSRTDFNRYARNSALTCCGGTGLEAHTRYQEAVYHKTDDGNGLYINLYMPATLDWAEKGFEIIQENDYLNEGAAKITVNGEGPLDVMLRVPYWVEKGFEVKVNGTIVIEDAAPSSYVTLSRDWNKGDVIEIAMPFSLRVERSPENMTGNVAVIFNGPYMLVQNAGSANRIEINGLNLDNLEESIVPAANRTNAHAFGSYSHFRFTVGDLTLDPFYSTSYEGSRYSPAFTIPRGDDNVAVNYSIAGGEGEINVLSNNRTVENGQRINSGSTVVYTAVPADGFMIKAWKVNGLTVNNNVSGRYVQTGIAKDTTVTVEFIARNAAGGTIFNIDEIVPGAELQAETVINEDLSGVVYMALYDGGRLVSITASNPFTATAGEPVSVDTILTLPKNIEGISVKVFVWDMNFVPARPAAEWKNAE